MSDLSTEIDALMTDVQSQSEYRFAVSEKMALLTLQSYGLSDEEIKEARQRIEERNATKLTLRQLLDLYDAVNKRDPTDVLKDRVLARINARIAGNMLRGSIERTSAHVGEGIQSRDGQQEEFEPALLSRRVREKARRRHKKTLRD